MPLETLSNILITVAGIIWGIELIPQIYKTVSTKETSGVSFIFFVMCLFAYSIYMVGNALVGNWVIVIAHIPSLIGNTIMVGLVYSYGIRKRN
jgi:uncharacterized protein with PQ loop repeat